MEWEADHVEHHHGRMQLVDRLSQLASMSRDKFDSVDNSEVDRIHGAQAALLSRKACMRYLQGEKTLRDAAGYEFAAFGLGLIAECVEPKEGLVT